MDIPWTFLSNEGTVVVGTLNCPHNVFSVPRVSVGVSSFTLVAISLERYFAICRPLQSRKWQTLSHAYRSILLIWGVAFVIMIPIPVHTNYENKRPGMYRCREKWEAEIVERIYTVFLVLMLLVIPLIAMSVAYGIVMHTLYEDITVSRTNGLNRPRHSESIRSLENSSFRKFLGNGGDGLSSTESTPHKRPEQRCMIRHSNPERNRAAKVRVIRMLFAVVIEYFICWTPITEGFTSTVTINIEYRPNRRQRRKSVTDAFTPLARDGFYVL
uniref:Gastrin/cholecystokinin type B receptor n=1 Tax=Magallana gigas TaxID=29159 RepID=A0A8W8LC57_MAGGI